MSPETKDALDTFIAILGSGGVAAGAAGLFGWLKARAERPAHIAKPGPTPQMHDQLAQFGGMVLQQTTMEDLIEALKSLAASHDRCTLVREAEMLQSKELAKAANELAEEQIKQRERHREEEHEEWREKRGLWRDTIDKLRDFKCA